MVPFICYIQNRHVHGNRLKVSGGWRGGGNGSDYFMGLGCSYGVMKCSESRESWRLRNVGSALTCGLRNGCVLCEFHLEEADRNKKLRNRKLRNKLLRNQE